MVLAKMFRLAEAWGLTPPNRKNPLPVGEAPVQGTAAASDFSRPRSKPCDWAGCWPIGNFERNWTVGGDAHFRGEGYERPVSYRWSAHRGPEAGRNRRPARVNSTVIPAHRGGDSVSSVYKSCIDVKVLASIVDSCGSLPCVELHESSRAPLSPLRRVALVPYLRQGKRSIGVDHGVSFPGSPMFTSKYLHWPNVCFARSMTDTTSG